MRITDHLLKKEWVRRAYSPVNSKPSLTSIGNAKKPMRKPVSVSYSMNQDVFMNELHSSAHIIYDCNYRSMRPKFKWDEKALKNIPDGFEDVTRTSVSWQEAIRGNKTSICGGNQPWIGDESGDPERVKKIKAHCNTMNIQAAIMSHFHSLFGTADGALYFYREGNKIAWKCFSYENGDNCTEVQDYEYPEQKMGVRYFDYEGFDAIELYRDRTVEFYVNVAPDSEDYLKLFGNRPAMEVTEDGYTLISSTNHGLDINPFVYFRLDDVPWGRVQANIEDFERLLSDCGENIKYYAYQILFLSGGAISLPNSNFGGKVIGSKTKDGDAKILEPADASNTLSIGFEKSYDAIRDGSKSVFIKPENLKGQNDSAAYLANLFWPEIQWASMFYAKYHPCMVKILDVIKTIVGIIEGNIIAYKNLQLSYLFEPFIPKNKLEHSTMLQQGVTAGFIPIETAVEESDLNPMDMDRLLAQEEREFAKAERVAKLKQKPEPTPKPTPNNK